MPLHKVRDIILYIDEKSRLRLTKFHSMHFHTIYTGTDCVYGSQEANTSFVQNFKSRDTNFI